MDRAFLTSEEFLNRDNRSLIHNKKSIDADKSEFMQVAGAGSVRRKGQKALTVSLPSALVKVCDNENPKSIEKGPLEKKEFLFKCRDTSHIRRSLSDTDIHMDNATYSPYHSPPYSNFARYLPCLSTPSDDSTSTNFASLSLSQSDVSSESSFRLPISASQLSLPEPPDGGWGWIVVVAAFFVHMVTEGVIVSFGIFIEDLVHEFQESMSATSWVGSFSYGVPALATPIASLIINHYGCRVTCMLGAAVSAIGCLLGCFANSLMTLVFTFGILSGLGTSLSMTAALVIVSVYFDEKRATATGLSIAGTGVGALVFAPAVEALLNVYTWRGTFMLMAGALLNIAVCGALMRPVETRNERRQRQRLAWLEHFAKESGFPNFTKSVEYLNTDVVGRIKILRDRLLAPRRPNINSNRVQALQNGNLTSKEIQHGITKMPNGISGLRLFEACKTRICDPKGDYEIPRLIFQVDPLPVIPENSAKASETILDFANKPSLSTKGSLTHVNCKGDKCLAPYQPIERKNYRQNLIIPSSRRAKIFLSADFFPNRDLSVTRYTQSLPCIRTMCDAHSSDKPVKSETGMITSICKPEMSVYTNQREFVCRNWIETTAPSQPQRDGQRKPHDINDSPVLCGSGIDPGEKITIHHSTFEHEDYLYRSSLIKAFGLNRASRCTALSLPDLTRVHRIRRRPGNSGSSIESDSSSDSSYPAWYCCGDLDKTDNACGRILSKCFAPCQVILPELNAKYLFQRLCDVRLFRRTTFDLFVLSNFLLYFWYNVTYFFMGVHALDLGFSETSAALLFSVLGGANMIGEVVVGLLADREWVDALTLYLVMLLACGLSTCLVPLLASFSSLSFYSGKSTYW